MSTVRLSAQYLKDLSFENLIPAKLARREIKPMAIEVRAKVAVIDLGDELWEAELFLGLTGRIDGKPAFVAELTYGVAYQVTNMDADTTRVFLHVEAPRLAYPHAASVLTQAAAGAGLPPVWLDPIDFNVLYQMQLKDAARAAEAPSATS
jgi:preprotein translocase subunit SecB